MAKEEKKSSFKLPKYLRLGKGAMWFDTDGPDSSGIKLYSFNEVFIGRGKLRLEKDPKTGQDIYLKDQPEIPRDKFDNQNPIVYGYIEKELPWYVETTTIPTEKLSRVITAYKTGVLVETNPKNPPKPERPEPRKDFKVDNKGERVFVGKNKEMYRKLMNLKSTEIQKFIVDCPKSPKTRDNLLDLLDYEKRGFNNLSRPRAEILDLIKTRLTEFGPTMSAIRKNDI
jgi:hypothetical protein